jgi:hypothetical protein
MKRIGNHFGFSESAVSHVGKLAGRQIDLDRELKKRLQTIEKNPRIASFKAWPVSFFNMANQPLFPR